MSSSANRRRPVKAKKKCCKSGPRCKKCPVVLKRLEGDGFAERLDRRHYMVVIDVPKPVMKRARARKS